MKGLIIKLSDRLFFFRWLLLFANYTKKPNCAKNIKLLVGYLFYKPLYSIYLVFARYLYPVGSFLKHIAQSLNVSPFVTYPLPKGISTKYKKLFISTYRLLPQLQVHNVSGNYMFIDSYNGIIANFKGLYSKSYNSVWGSRAIEIYNGYPKLVYEHLFSAIATNNVYNQNAAKVYVVHHWFNYYHWITETLTRLWEVEKMQGRQTVILPHTIAKYSYVTDTLKVFKNIDIEWVPEECNIVKLKNAELIECKRSCDDYNPDFLNAFRDRYLAHIQSAGYIDHTQLQLGKRILILRKKATRRNIINEAEVVAVCTKYGFTAIDFEDYTLPQQAYIMNNANIVVGLHGAGLTNMAFMPANSTIFELQREVTHKDKMFSTVYYTMANALGHSYYIQFCKAEEGKSFFDANYIVDTVALEENLKLIQD